MASHRKNSVAPNLSLHRQDVHLESIGETIRRLRIAQGISQEKLTLFAEVDRRYVGRVERGDNNAAVLTFKRLDDALGMTVSELMSEAHL